MRARGGESTAASTYELRSYYDRSTAPVRQSADSRRLVLRRQYLHQLRYRGREPTEGRTRIRTHRIIRIIEFRVDPIRSCACCSCRGATANDTIRAERRYPQLRSLANNEVFSSEQRLRSRKLRINGRCPGRRPVVSTSSGKRVRSYYDFSAVVPRCKSSSCGGSLSSSDSSESEPRCGSCSMELCSKQPEPELRQNSWGNLHSCPEARLLRNMDKRLNFLAPASIAVSSPCLRRTECFTA